MSMDGLLPFIKFVAYLLDKALFSPDFRLFERHNLKTLQI